ncbi:hypothetical protein [Paucibacter sp. M5-1]|uniref:hypothetical protein n=1 Tax=Paucibacter sp. M5-1 TaxID=3015998 RepID=UPI0022B9305B|nr:hypothetical protein [Paucibacter sp. M5-1]MCZ7883787.1 hypothetical protein [Paucibacter sp. M5-1]
MRNEKGLELWRAAKGSRHAREQRKFEQRRWSEEPTYREKRQKRASRPRPQHVEMHRWFHLSPNENKVLDALLLRRSKVDDHVARRALDEHISTVAAAAAFRCFGFERHMVLDIERDDGRRTTLLVDNVSVSDSYRASWDLSGYSLRKDGTIGSKPAQCFFTRARIMRRRLDGNWQLLRPRNKPRFRANAHTPR